MTPRTASHALGLVIAAALVIGEASAMAIDLTIPYGYLNHSGGFFVVRSAGQACLRFAPAGGCTGAMNYPAAAHQVYDNSRSGSATFSWYAGQVPAHCRDSHTRQIATPPAAVEGPSVEAWEEVGPGLPIETP